MKDKVVLYSLKKPNILDNLIWFYYGSCTDLLHMSISLLLAISHLSPGYLACFHQRCLYVTNS